MHSQPDTWPPRNNGSIESFPRLIRPVKPERKTRLSLWLLAFITGILSFQTPLRASESRVGLFAGEFDPVHRGHLEIAQQAAERLKLTRLVFIPLPLPAPDNPGHANNASLAFRVHLLQDALADWGNPRFSVFSDPAPAAVAAAARTAAARAAPAVTAHKLIQAARQKFAGDSFFHLMNTADFAQAIPGVLPIPGERRTIVVLQQPGDLLPTDLSLKEAIDTHHLFCLPVQQSRPYSETQIRRWCSHGEHLALPHSVTESVRSTIIREGAYGLGAHASWLEALAELATVQTATATATSSFRDTQIQQCFYAISHPAGITGTTKTTGTTEAAKVAEITETQGMTTPIWQPAPPDYHEGELDLTAAHLIDTVAPFLQEHLTIPGIRIFQHPLVTPVIFTGTEDQMSHWLASQQCLRGTRISRRHAESCPVIHLVRTTTGEFWGIIGNSWGKDRSRHHQALVLACRAQRPQPRPDLVVIRNAVDPDGELLAGHLFRQALRQLPNKAVETVIIGFAEPLLNMLHRRYHLWEMLTRPPSLPGKRLLEARESRLQRILAERFTRHPLLGWPHRQVSDPHLPHYLLPYRNGKDQEKTLLLCNLVYGDAIAPLLQVLMLEKGIEKVVILGSGSSLRADPGIGTICQVGQTIDQHERWRAVPDVSQNQTAPVTAQQYSRVKAISITSQLERPRYQLDTAQNPGGEVAEQHASAIAAFYERYRPACDYFQYLLFITDAPDCRHPCLADNCPGVNVPDMLESMIDLLLLQLDIRRPATTASY